MASDPKRRFIVISGNGSEPITCMPQEVPHYIGDFVGPVEESMSGPVTLTEVWMTESAYNALPEWEG